jgi:predicted homoserine dehydrogenase-like protein
LQNANKRKIRFNLAESSKEGYGPKGAVFEMMIIVHGSFKHFLDISHISNSAALRNHVMHSPSNSTLQLYTPNHLTNFCSPLSMASWNMIFEAILTSITSLK